MTVICTSLMLHAASNKLPSEESRIDEVLMECRRDLVFRKDLADRMGWSEEELVRILESFILRIRQHKLLGRLDQC
jgi:hypothetical protein